jgi:hypothetical protein
VQHNSRRAELHRLQEKHPEIAARIQERELEEGDTESSSSEEEVRYVLTIVLSLTRCCLPYELLAQCPIPEDRPSRQLMIKDSPSRVVAVID